MRFLLLAAVGLSLATSCSPKKPATPVSDAQAPCCAECKAAASKDPQARDLELLPCSTYAGRVVNGEPALSERCTAWFAEHPTMVGACRSAR